VLPFVFYIMLKLKYCCIPIQTTEQTTEVAKHLTSKQCQGLNPAGGILGYPFHNALKYPDNMYESCLI